jgi:hypothetical protein
LPLHLTHNKIAKGELSMEIRKFQTPTDTMKMLYDGVFILQDDNTLVLAKTPHYVIAPHDLGADIGGQKLYIRDAWVNSEEMECPMCGEQGKYGLIQLINEMVIVACTNCKQFIWTKLRNNLKEGKP